MFTEIEQVKLSLFWTMHTYSGNTYAIQVIKDTQILALQNDAGAHQKLRKLGYLALSRGRAAQEPRFNVARVRLTS